MDSPSAQPSTSQTPLIWLVLGDKRGDNAQVEIVEQQLPPAMHSQTCAGKR